MNEKISIIIPIYNAEKYLERCLNSITGQTLKNLEIILVNDGSTDKSEMICKNFAIKDNRIRIINIKKSGVSIARNIGINLSTGNWIGFVDADDCIENDMYEILYSNAIKYNVNISVCGYNRAFKYNGIIELNKVVLDTNCVKLNYKEAMESLLSNAKDFATANWNKLYKKNFIGDIRFDETITNGEDLLFNFYILSKNKKDVIFDKRKKYNYFFNEGSASIKKFFNKNLLTEAKSWNLIYNKSLSDELFYLNKSIKEHYINTLYYLISKCFKTDKTNFRKVYIELKENYINDIDFSNISYGKVFLKLIILKMINLFI